MKTLTCALAIAAGLLLGADCGGSREVDREEWRIRGTYRVTGFYCGTEAVTAPATMQARITPPNFYEWAYAGDGLGLDIRISGETCTWGARYDLRSTSETTYDGAGAGLHACTPSSAACRDFMLLTEGGDICGVGNEERGPVSHTPVPAVGGTLDATLLEDTRCADGGHAGRITFRLTRVE